MKAYGEHPGMSTIYYRLLSFPSFRKCLKKIEDMGYGAGECKKTGIDREKSRMNDISFTWVDGGKEVGISGSFAGQCRCIRCCTAFSRPSSVSSNMGKIFPIASMVQV